MGQMSFLKRLFGFEKKASTLPIAKPVLSSEAMAMIESEAIDAVEITLVESVSFSRLGGKPLLPPDFAWPTTKRKGKDKGFNFLAQIDLSEVNDERLPLKGYLYFFFLFTDLPFECRVWFVQGDANEFRELLPPASKAAPSIEFEPNFIKFSSVRTYPPEESEAFRRLNLSEADAEAYEDFFFEVSSDDHLLGHPDPTQFEMEGECHDAYPGISKSPSDWTLLLQVGENESTDAYWGDCGKAYFWIRHEDLANHNFDRVYFTVQFL